MTTEALEPKNVVLGGFVGFLGTELKPALQFQKGFFPEALGDLTGMLLLVKTGRSPVMDRNPSSGK